MARNKYPEETVDLILETATKLFIKNGYEHTSIQDIINNLGGLSKGAIYHHFKSKEDILMAVTERITEQSNKLLRKILNRTDLTGKEKLRQLLIDSMNQPVNDDICAAAPNIGSSPAFLYNILKDSIEVTAPEYILPTIEQGIADGSIQTEYPKELAEVIILICNIWLNPLIFNDSMEDIYRKYKTFDKILRSFGLDILDDSVYERLCSLMQTYSKNK